MKDIKYWKREGFVFEARFPGEYDLWLNRKTMQKLRRYVDGREWLSDLATGEYTLVTDTDNDGGAFVDTPGSLIGLSDCLDHINIALNYWYPLRSQGDSDAECDARHRMLFEFRDRLTKQLEINATAHVRAVASNVQQIVGNSGGDE